MTFDVSAMLRGVPCSLRKSESDSAYGPGDLELREEVEADRLIACIIWVSANSTHSGIAG